MTDCGPSVWDLPMRGCVECDDPLEHPDDDLCVGCAILEGMVKRGEID